VSTIAGIAALSGGAPASSAQVHALLAAGLEEGGAAGTITTWTNGRVALGRSAWGADANGAQPYVDRASGSAIALEGRIDNLHELRDALGASRHQEAHPAAIVLAVYTCWGEAGVARILGDFAFVIWDAPAGRLFCARDALGQRPLFYAIRPGCTIAASDPRQVLTHPDVPAAPNEGMVAEFLTGLAVTTGDTVWDGVSRLPQAHALVVSAGGTRLVRYWDFNLASTLRYRRSEEYDEHLRDLFSRAVRCRTAGERTAGIFLSGGIDSSAIAGMAASLRDAGGPEVRAFSTVYPGDACDESRFIDETVRRWAIPSERLAFVPPSRADFEWEVERFHDLPSEPSGASSHPLRRRIREAGVRVVLTGYGGDEWFTGSPSHTADLLQQGRLIAALRQFRHDAALPGRGYSYLGLARTAVGPLLPPLARRALKPLAGSRPLRFDWIPAAFSERVALRDRLKPRADPPASSRAQRDVYRVGNSLQRAFANEREYRAARAAGIDERHPFLDRRIAEFGLALPESERWHLGAVKVVLRRALGDLLVESVRTRNDKAEFSSSYAGAIAAAGGRRAFERLRSADAGWVEGRVALRMHDEMIRLYSAGDPAYIRLADVLWTILGIELWLERGVGARQLTFQEDRTYGTHIA
jgi:asparagine synthase (glutamine-hydrolysing)